MRRWIRSLIVALLCLTLFVDTAKACWFLRHRRRSQACLPVACRPICPSACCLPCEPVEPVAHAVIERHADSECTGEFVESTAPATATVADTQAAPADAPRTAEADAGGGGESVVEHGPTLVVGPQPAAATPARDPDSVVAAAPMPLESATPVAPQAQAAATREPLPDLKPAQPAVPAMVAPASNDEPVAEPVPGTASQATLAAPPADKDDASDAAAPAAAEDKSMPVETAPAADLAGGPEVKPTPSEPQEPNLFDLYGDDEEADAMPAEEPADPADIGGDEDEDADKAEMDDEDAAAEDTADDGADDDADAPADEAEEMEEESADDAAADDEETGADEPSDEAADASEEQPEADEPAAAAFAVPDEPMRRWTDDTGTRHAQGWLVELHGDRVRILKTNGRHTTVPLKSLSAADRDYVSAVGDRLAAERKGHGPAATTTAGLERAPDRGT